MTTEEGRGEYQRVDLIPYYFIITVQMTRWYLLENEILWRLSHEEIDRQPCYKENAYSKHMSNEIPLTLKRHMSVFQGRQVSRSTYSTLHQKKDMPSALITHPQQEHLYSINGHLNKKNYIYIKLIYDVQFSSFIFFIVTIMDTNPFIRRLIYHHYF